MAEKFDSPAMPGVKPMPEPPDPRIIPLDRQTALTHQQVEQVRFGLGDTGPLAQAVMNANVPALAKQLATGAVSCLSTRRPADPVVGQMIYETDTQLSYFWDGSAWVNASSPPTGAAGGMLSGTYPNPSVASISGLAAGGGLSGTYPNPTVASIPSTAMPSGSVVQVTYNGTKTEVSTFNTSRTGGAYIGLAGTITPKFSNSVIFIQASIQCRTFTSAGSSAGIRCYRNGTVNLGMSDTENYAMLYPGPMSGKFSIMGTDVPGTTAATTYYFYGGNYQAYQLDFQDDSQYYSWVLLMEIRP